MNKYAYTLKNIQRQFNMGVELLLHRIWQNNSLQIPHYKILNNCEVRIDAFIYSFNSCDYTFKALKFA